MNRIIKMATNLNSPAYVSIAGAAVIAGAPWLHQAISLGGWSMSTMQCCNILAFTTNVISVSIPGRIDGQQDQNMRNRVTAPGSKTGGTNPTTDPTSTTTTTTNTMDVYSDRSLVTPSGWAFAIWGPIYLGEALFCGYGQFNYMSNSELMQITAPFIAANIFQSLWCASFRPKYFDLPESSSISNHRNENNNWKKLVSVFMLGGTAYSLSLIGSMSTSNLVLLPMTVHFGWTTAATLVNLNSSLSAMKNLSNVVVIAAGHSAAIIATGIGMYITITQSLPVYGLTIAWALAACSSGAGHAMKNNDGDIKSEDQLIRASKVQQKLCLIGSITCLLTSLSIWFG